MSWTNLDACKEKMRKPRKILLLLMIALVINGNQVFAEESQIQTQIKLAVAEQTSNLSVMNIGETASQQSADVVEVKDQNSEISSNTEQQKNSNEVTVENNSTSTNNLIAATDPNEVPVQDLKGSVKEVQPEEPSAIRGWLDGSYATGNWWGLRNTLEDHGITISGSYTNFDFMKLHGGISKKNEVQYQGIVTTSVNFDTEKMGLWKGGRLYGSFWNSHGEGISRDYVGDWQLVNTYDCGRLTQLYEYYYEQGLFDGKLKIKLGKQDANNDFIVFDSNFQFNNGGFYIQNVPITTYPAPGLGVMATIQPVSWFTLKSGIFDGNALNKGLGFRTFFNGRQNYMIMNEAAFTHNYKNYKGKYAIGHWINTNDYTELTSSANPKRYHNAQGIYSGFDQMVFKENSNPDDVQGLSLFGQFGWAPEKRREVPLYFGLGAVYKGLIPKRDNDVVGFGTNFARFSDKLDIPHGETVMEGFYKVQLTPWLAVQPDIQYINKPSGTFKNAWALGVKTSITF